MGKSARPDVESMIEHLAWEMLVYRIGFVLLSCNTFGRSIEHWVKYGVAAKQVGR